MDNQKYLAIITLLDGQNFSMPDGSPDRVEATVFAEARFSKESVLRSDPIKLTNSNPEFATELAWQLDRKSLHQLRVERKVIKLQIFMQTTERKKPSRFNKTDQTNGWSNDSSDTHKVELIGYTILDLRSARPQNQPKFQWLPLLNPKFRKSVYNRPEIQLAITLSRLEDEDKQDPLNSTSTISLDQIDSDDHDWRSEDDHHFRFTIDLKKFTYTPSQRLIPTLRELVIRYSYPFFGYKDTITTDASIPINTSSSIVVSGFCEFNFATTNEPLLTALNELPLSLEILANEVVGTCDIHLAKELGLNEETINFLEDEPLSSTSSVPIYGLDGGEIGQLQVYLCLKDLGKPPQKFRAQNVEAFKEDQPNELCDGISQRDNEQLQRIYQRIEAKEAKRDEEFRAKIDELNALGEKFKNYLTCVSNLERMLADSLDQLKKKNAILDNKLDLIDSKISQVITKNNNVN